jgi:uncharacterized membrane protein
MKSPGKYVATSLLTGLLIAIPLYLAVLLLVKVLQSVARVVRPLAKVLPEGIPAEEILSVLLVLVICFLIGAMIRTPAGRRARENIDKFLSDKLPAYAMFQGMTQQLLGMHEGHVWKPALAELAAGLRPAFIIEECEDGRYTVFVPSAPAPFSGAIYILTRERVHPVDIPFTQALRSVTRWGAGSKNLVAAMNRGMPGQHSGAGRLQLR